MTSDGPASRAGRYELHGLIASAAFASGDRFVVGRWDDSPVGPMGDVMWVDPTASASCWSDGTMPPPSSPPSTDSDRVEKVAFQCGWDGAALEVTAGEVVLGMRAGPGRRIPMARLRSIPAARWVEGPVARALLGVRVFGTSPSGVREWYRADRYRPVVAARAALQGRDLGSLRRFGDPTRFGFSEPPRRPSIVHVRPLLLDPTGDLERLLVRLGVRGPGGTPR